MKAWKQISENVCVWQKYRKFMGDNMKPDTERANLYLAPHKPDESYGCVSGECLYVEHTARSVLLAFVDNGSIKITSNAQQYLANNPWVAGHIALQINEMIMR